MRLLLQRVRRRRGERSFVEPTVSYLFTTSDEEQQMLSAIGVPSIEALFAAQVPEALRLKRPLNMPPALDELSLEQLARQAAAATQGAGSSVCFLGGGAYDHFIPAAVDAIAGRSEFYTAYTPYQAEASQGSLQVFFEFQSLICELTGMDAANASLYEGGTALCEAILMSLRATKRNRVVLLESINPLYRQVVETYLTHLGCEIVTVPCPDGTASLEAVEQALGDRSACLAIQQPNFFGCLEEASRLSELAHAAGALAIHAFHPLSLGLLRKPADCGADIAVAEGQSLGIPLQFGGPYLGIIACREQFIRQMPGRLIGETTDRNGRRCFVLNLQAREQHIRREKATSNICTNQGLMAIRATVYLSLMGPQGLREVSQLCADKAQYAAQKLGSLPGYELAFQRPFFNEFALRCTSGAQAAMAKAKQAGFDIGPDLRTAGLTGRDDCLLIAVTECRTRAQIDALAEALA